MHLNGGSGAWKWRLSRANGKLLHNPLGTSLSVIILRQTRWINGWHSDALRINENSPDALALRALVLFLTNRLPQALQHAQSTLRLDPEHSKARLLIRRIKEVERLKEEGNSAFKSGRLATAVEKYGETLEVIGDNEEEGHGGIIRATLLSNRATALFKVRFRFFLIHLPDLIDSF